MAPNLDDDPSFLLARANALSVQAGNAALLPHGLRVRSYSVLARSTTSPAPTQRDLADHLRLDPSQVVALVDELEGKGLVAREADPADRRTKVVRATARGDEVLRGAEKDLRAAEAVLHTRLTPDQRSSLAEILRALAFPGPGDEPA